MRHKVKSPLWRGFLLLLLPLILDSGTQLVSDLIGLGQGFRGTNEGLSFQTKDTLPASFYAGDALGLFNSMMHLVSGLPAGLAIVWMAFSNFYNLTPQEL